MAEDPAIIIDLVAGCRLAVRQVVGVELDFTQDTLPLLDHYAAEAKGSREEVALLIAPMCGAYFGEVLRRTLGPARWELAETNEPSETRLQFEQVFLELNPMGIALEALIRVPVEGWGAHLEVRPADRPAVSSAVALLGDVREEDYYRFGVRFEVIEQVVQALLRKTEGTGDIAPTFDAAAYARARETGGTILH
jgi:hypothetical protein